ncbi:MAG: signal transduction histidine kinase [Paraglaciecola sp.]|jgi:signal transduction histidine kinase
MTTSLPVTKLLVQNDQPQRKMKTTQIQNLLEESKAHYRSRKLKKAMNTVQIALDFGAQGAAKKQDLDAAKLLLARIYSTNGKYQNDASFYQKSLTYLEDLKEEESKHKATLKIEIALTFGEVYQNLLDFEKSEVYLNNAFKESQKASNSGGIVRALAGLSQNAILKKDYEKAYEFAQDGLTFLESSGQAEDENLLVEIYQQLSEVQIWRKEYSQALELSQTLVKLSQRTGNLEKEVMGLKNIAVVCSVKSNYKIGMQYFLEALNKSEKIGFRKQIAQILVNIGTIYAHLFNYEEAIKRYQEVLEDYEDILDDKNQVVIYNNLGNIHYTTEQADVARDYFEKAFKLALKYNFRDLLAHTLAQLSRTDLQSGHLERAINYAQKAQELIDELGNINGQQINLLNLANIEAKQDNLQKAVTITEEGIEAAKIMKDDATEIRGYKMLAKFYKELGKFEEALSYQIIYSKIQEEFAKVRRNRQFLDLEIRHAIREKQSEIEQLTKENEYQSLLLDKSDQIARQNQELIQANEELRQFAYVASHDLKEPLRMIGSYTQIIDRLIGEQLDEKQQLYFKYVTDGVVRMNALLDALLKYATVGKSDEELEDIDLNEIGRIGQYNLKVRIEENDAIIKMDDLPKVKGRRTLMIQLFQNLLGNAIKFRRPDVQSEIQVSATETETEHIISIQDNGIGIADHNKDRVFEIFQRLHQRYAYEGTGIGLAICMKIVQRLGGRLWMESEEGKGTTFFFSVLK